MKKQISCSKEDFDCVVLLDLNKALGNTMDAHEAAQMHQNFSQQLLQDHIAACSLPEHNLISVCEADEHCSSIRFSTRHGFGFRVRFHWPLFTVVSFRHLCFAVVRRVIFSFCFFSGLMARLLFRFKHRMGQPPASQACYESERCGYETWIWCSLVHCHATEWELTTCYLTTVIEIWEDYLFSRLLPGCPPSHFNCC